MNNVLPIKPTKPKADRYVVYHGEVDENNQVIEKSRVGIALMRPESKTFRLKLFMFDGVQYFITPVKDSDVKYRIVSLEEYTLPGGEVMTHWNHVGDGVYFGNYIKVNFHLLPCDLFVSLFPALRLNQFEQGSVA